MQISPRNRNQLRLNFIITTKAVKIMQKQSRDTVPLNKNKWIYPAASLRKRSSCLKGTVSLILLAVVLINLSKDSTKVNIFILYLLYTMCY